MSTRAFSRRRNNQRWCVRLMPIRVSACPMAVFSGFYESHEPPPLGKVCSIAPPLRNDHQNCQQSGYILHRCFVACCPGGCRGDTEQVVTRWQCPVASGEAMVMLHCAMCSILLQCVQVAIEMACNGGAFVCPCRLFCLA